jgi:polyhydroxybutyrate depolymerase
VIALSAFESFAFWLQRNQCSSDPAAIESEMLPDIASDDNSTVGHLALRNCANATEVHLYGIQGGGHTWPGRYFDVDIALGALNRDIDASAVIIDWLAGLPVRGSMAEATLEPEP